MKQLYIVTYENTHWCGGELSVVVYATDTCDAELLTTEHMEQTQRELFSDSYEEEPEYAEECPFVVNDIALLNESHDEWEYFKDYTQASFYPVIGEP